MNRERHLIGVEMLTAALMMSLLAVMSVHGKFSSKTAYLDRFTTDQLEYINEPRNYRIAGCR